MAFERCPHCVAKQEQGYERCNNCGRKKIAYPKNDGVIESIPILMEQFKESDGVQDRK